MAWRPALRGLTRLLRLGLVSRAVVACFLLWTTCGVEVASQQVVLENPGAHQPRPAIFDPFATPDSLGLTDSDRKAWNTPGAKAERGRRRHEIHPISDVYGEGESCTPSPLWGREVDTMSFELGCTEIEALLEGSKLVGSGVVRDVYLTKHEGKLVAVKMLKEPAGRRERKRRWAERKLQHWAEVVSMDAVRGSPYVVGILGVCNTTVVTEAYSTDLEAFVSRRASALPIRDIVSAGISAAKGLQALHEASDAPIVHFDIKASQFLLTNGGQLKLDGGLLKLNDFNSAYFMSTSSRPDGAPCEFSMQPWQRVVPWRPPEFAKGEPMDEKVDVFSMGFVYYSMLAGGLPFGITNDSRNAFMESTGGTPPFGSSWHRGFVEVIREMLREPRQRPSAREVVVRLEAILKDLPPR